MSDAETRAIDRATPIPFYYQLQEILKEEIERGTWRSGDLLPSEAQLERRFGVSRTVVRQALDVLQADGQISRVKGKRSMVTEPKFRWEARSDKFLGPSIRLAAAQNQDRWYRNLAAGCLGLCAKQTCLSLQP